MISVLLIVFNLPESCLTERTTRTPDPPTCNDQMIRLLVIAILFYRLPTILYAPMTEARLERLVSEYELWSERIELEMCDDYLFVREREGWKGLQIHRHAMFRWLGWLAILNRLFAYQLTRMHRWQGQGWRGWHLGMRHDQNGKNLECMMITFLQLEGVSPLFWNWFVGF